MGELGKESVHVTLVAIPNYWCHSQKNHVFLPMHQSIIGGVSGRDCQALSTSTISINPGMFVTSFWTLTSSVAPATATSTVVTSLPSPLPLLSSLLAAPLPLLPLFLNHSSSLCHPAWHAPSISVPIHASTYSGAMCETYTHTAFTCPNPVTLPLLRVI